jgi:hypothetical protein
MNDPSIIVGTRPIHAGAKIMRAAGAGAKCRNGQRVPRGELETDAGRVVSTETRVLAVNTFELTNVRVWTVYNNSGEKVRSFPFRERAAADALARTFARPGYVVPETATV